MYAPLRGLPSVCWHSHPDNDEFRSIGKRSRLIAWDRFPVCSSFLRDQGAVQDQPRPSHMVLTVASLSIRPQLTPVQAKADLAGALFPGSVLPAPAANP